MSNLLNTPLLLEGEYEDQPQVIRSHEASTPGNEYAKLLEEIQTLRREYATSIRVMAERISRIETGLLMAASGKSNMGSASVAGVDNRTRTVWESWQQKLGGHAAKAIEVLLEHGSMSVPQLRIALKCSQQNVYNVTSRLHRLGLLNKNGGKYSLKEL